MLKKSVVLAVIFGFLLSASLSFAEEKQAERAYTKEEMVAGIKKILDDEDEILSKMPGLKKLSTKSGGSFYTYDGLKLEEFDNENLSKIFTRVRQEATRIRAERLNRQLENVKRNQALAAGAKGHGPRMPVTPSQPPRVYKAPVIPAVSTPVPQGPKSPVPPPTAPRK